MDTMKMLFEVGDQTVDLIENPETKTIKLSAFQVLTDRLKLEKNE